MFALIGNIPRYPSWEETLSLWLVFDDLREYNGIFWTLRTGKISAGPIVVHFKIFVGT